MNPLDEYLETYGEVKLASPKTASFWPAAKAAIPGVAVSVGGSIAATGLVAATGKAYQALTKRRDFSSMMEADPGLREYQQEDPRTFNRRFTALRSMAPEFAAQPLVAAHFMRMMGENPSNVGGTLVNLAKEHAGLTRGNMSLVPDIQRAMGAGVQYGLNSQMQEARRQQGFEEEQRRARAAQQTA